MASIIKAETYEKLKKAIKDDEAVMCLVRDLEEGIERYLKERAEYFENALYSKLVQKLVTKEEFKSEINRLDQKIDFVYKDLNNKIQELGKRIEIMYTEINKRMDYQHQSLQSEIRRLETEIKRVEQNINTKFLILIGIMLLGFTLLNPYTATIIKSVVSFIK